MVKIVFSSFFGGRIDDGSDFIDFDHGTIDTLQEARHILDKCIPDIVHSMTITQDMYNILSKEYFFE